ncbi:MAG: helix-turn-helix domain-containing protein [Flavobacteriaceae bacterium]|nr:helix-turn-helix domain-containing protein [Flavobacteriaceae bacterium]
MNITEVIKTNFPQLAASSPLLDELKNIGLLQNFDKDTIVLKENSYIKVIPLLINGLIKIYKEEENGNEVLLYYIKPGETCIVSVMAGEKDEKATVKGVVEEDCSVILIPKDKLYSLRKKFPAWNMFIYEQFNDKFYEVIDMVKVLTFSNKEKRLEDFLIKKSALNKTKTVNKSHQEIANELGSSREVISRLLKKLEKDGKVELSLRKIKIL